jgi:hypothetical protein
VVDVPGVHSFFYPERLNEKAHAALHGNLENVQNVLNLVTSLVVIWTNILRTGIKTSSWCTLPKQE